MLLLSPTWVLGFVVSCLVTFDAVVSAQVFDCDPCIDRSKFTIKAIVHGTASDAFWQQVQAAAVQSGKDMMVNFEMELYETFDPDQMAADIVNAATGDAPPSALIVSIPSESVERAVSTAVSSGIPVFGLNSGYEVAQDLGVLGFVAMDDYQGGVYAANEMLRIANISNVLYINHEDGNEALQNRLEGFAATLSPTTVDQLTADFSDETAFVSIINMVLDDCPYDAVLTAGAVTVESTLAALVSQGCTDTLLGTFDTNDAVYAAIASDDVAFAISQQQHLQGALPVLMASLYATTGKVLAQLSDSEHGAFLSGPVVITKDNLPSDTLQTCQVDGFPVCPNTLAADGSEATCACTDRSAILIAGVLHGVTTDPFWNPVFAASEQAARDNGVTLLLERLRPEENNFIIYDKMAEQIRQYCDEGVDGLFVSIPNANLIESIEYCQSLNVPVVSINAGAEESAALGLVHHMGQLEYNAAYRAGLRMLEAGMRIGYCLNHEIGNRALVDRCNGFADAIATHPESFYFGMLEVPRNNDELYKETVEGVLGEDFPWLATGLLLSGPVQVRPARELKKAHPMAYLGTFDVSDEIYAGSDAGDLLFGIDQNAYLQGYMPIPLLTQIAYTDQALVNQAIESGPMFVESPPTAEQQTCERNLFEACNVTGSPTALPSPTNSPTIDNEEEAVDDDDLSRGAITGIVIGSVLLALLFLILLYVGYRWNKLDEYVKELKKQGAEIPPMSTAHRLSATHKSVEGVVEKARRESFRGHSAAIAVAIEEVRREQLARAGTTAIPSEVSFNNGERTTDIPTEVSFWA